MHVVNASDYLVALNDQLSRTDKTIPMAFRRLKKEQYFGGNNASN